MVVTGRDLIEPAASGGEMVASVTVAAADSVLPAVRSVQATVRSLVFERLASIGGLWPLEAGEPPASRHLALKPGAGALLNDDDLAALLSLMSTSSEARIVLPLTDFASLNGREVQRTSGTCFSAESGADLIALSLHPDTPAALREKLAPLELRCDLMRRALRFFADRDAEVAVVGPLQVHTWRYLEDEVACRVRVFADAGPQVGGLVPALYGKAEARDFLGWMEEMGQAVFLDTRPFFASGPMPAEEDFYWSDLGMFEKIAHVGLRRLTEVALSASYPIVLGGPSVVNGVLYALVETAWRTSPDLDRGYQVAW